MELWQKRSTKRMFRFSIHLLYITNSIYGFLECHIITVRTCTVTSVVIFLGYIRPNKIQAIPDGFIFIYRISVLPVFSHPRVYILGYMYIQRAFIFLIF